MGKINECSLCKQNHADCGEVEHGIKGCEEFVATDKNCRLLHSIFFEEEYNNARHRLAFYVEWLPLLKALDEFYFGKDDLTELFGIEEEKAEAFKKLCGELSEAIEDKLARM